MQNVAAATRASEYTDLGAAGPNVREATIKLPSQRCSRCRIAAVSGLVVLIGVAIVLAVVLTPDLTPEAKFWKRACSAMCQGPIIQAVNQLGIFNDSKDFVDMPILSKSPEAVLSMFASVDPASQPAVKAFLAANFGEAGSDLEAVQPTDWKPGPAVVTMQRNETLRAFAESVHAIWPALSRRVKASVFAHPERHTLLPLPRPFVVAGGRFRELYFWDTLWIVMGLLRSEMPETATAVVENLAWAARLLGKVPNGARAYYADRSQPPVLAIMLEAVVNVTGNYSLAQYVLPAVEQELEWYGASDGSSYRAQQTAQIKGHTLHRYNVQVSGPRPESWREDQATARGAGLQPGSQAALKLWGELASGAETGWDYSSRWLRDGRALDTIRTSQIVPADLNAIMVAQLRAAARLQRAYGSKSAAADFDSRADRLVTAINEVLWDDEAGWWADYDLEAGARRPQGAVTPAAFVPLWAGCAEGIYAERAGRAADSMIGRSGLYLAGGLVTSREDTGQQWDSPSAWAPLQWLSIRGLERAGRGADARELARRWLRSNLLGFQSLGAMLEKYDAFHPGSPAGGGEYKPQEGFGWTNGAALDLLASFDWQSLE